MQARRAVAERDFALKQLARAAALEEFNGFPLYGVAPAGKAFTSEELMRRAERIVLRAAPDDTRTDMLAAMGGQYIAMDNDADARRLLREAYRLSRQEADPAIRARAACGVRPISTTDRPPILPPWSTSTTSASASASRNGKSRTWSRSCARGKPALPRAIAMMQPGSGRRRANYRGA